MREAISKVRSTVKFYTSMRFSTIAGTLVYFLLMSIAPFVVWLTLLLGSVDLEQFISSAVFESIRPFLVYLKDTAQTAASGAGIILLATSLYSSTNFFYHLRRSGEIIYGTAKVKGGIGLRILSAVLIILTIFLFAFTAAFAVTGKWILDSFMPEVLSDIIAAVFITVIAFAVALLLNLFACPYRLTVEEAVPGSILTTALWILFIIGFAVYLQFASPGKLYGAIASVIVFLLWSYFMTCCLVIGMIKNSTYLTQKTLKKRL